VRNPARGRFIVSHRKALRRKSPPEMHLWHFVCHLVAYTFFTSWGASVLPYVLSSSPTAGRRRLNYSVVDAIRRPLHGDARRALSPDAASSRPRTPRTVRRARHRKTAAPTLLPQPPRRYPAAPTLAAPLDSATARRRWAMTKRAGDAAVSPARGGRDEEAPRSRSAAASRCPRLALLLVTHT
jgi:hypothetical protein